MSDRKRMKRFPKHSLSSQQADGVLRSTSRRKSLIAKSDDATELRSIKPNLAIKKLREKRIESVKQQMEKHEEKIEKEKPRKDTTKDYWRKEIDEKFLKQLDEDKEYLEDK